MKTHGNNVKTALKPIKTLLKHYQNLLKPYQNLLKPIRTYQNLSKPLKRMHLCLLDKPTAFHSKVASVTSPAPPRGQRAHNSAKLKAGYLKAVWRQ